MNKDIQLMLLCIKEVELALKYHYTKQIPMDILYLLLGIVVQRLFDRVTSQHPRVVSLETKESFKAASPLPVVIYIKSSFTSSGVWIYKRLYAQHW